MVARNQPAKLAAFEGQFQTRRGDLSLVGLPDVATKTMRFEVAIPGLLSYLVNGDADKPVTGLDRVPREYWPPVLVSFLAYHAMVGIGTFFIALTLFASLPAVARHIFENALAHVDVRLRGSAGRRRERAWLDGSGSGAAALGRASTRRA